MEENEHKMAIINDNELLINNGRVFLRSENINVFPCSRRGQAGLDFLDTALVKYFDPEARLNTERTNRLHTALNGFKDSFISSYDSVTSTLVFVLAGYYIEIKDFRPEDIASALGSDTAAIYAHLRLHTHVSLGVKDYFTEMLYRQSDSEDDKNYLDVSYVDGDRNGDFFVGVSFAKELVDNDDDTVYNLPLFSYANEEWELVQSSLLPKIDHGETEDSVKINGNFTVKHGEQTALHVTKDRTFINSITVPTIDVKTIENTQDNAGVNINDTLTITAGQSAAVDTLNVNEIKSRSADKITIKSPVELTTDAPLTLNKGLEVVAGDVTINKKLAVWDTISATKTFSDPAKVNLDAKKAKIETLSSTTATIATVNSDDINQKIGDAYYNVPVVFVQQLNSADSNEYQLKISRANVVPYENN
jgi:hypothetical protein